MRKYLSILICAAMLACFAPARVRAAETLYLPVVMYHHVSRQPDMWNKYVIAPSELESDLEYLRSNGWESISMAELLAWQDGNFEMPEKPFMISFDDGFESTVAYAEPILEEYGYRGIVAVIGSVCSEYSECGENEAEYSNMSWEDARDAAARGTLEVQCHTWDMHGLGVRTGCNKISWEDEGVYRKKLVRDLQHFLEESGKRGVELTMSIAYPYGAYCSSTTEAVKALGFRAAFTCTEEINVLTGSPDELYHLGRCNRAHGRSSAEFFHNWEEIYQKTA